jgi:DNA-binding PadR family transcriptional regulator
MAGSFMDNKGNVPLREATFFILLSMAANPKHGYAIMKDIENLSEGRVKLSTGTLYGAIKRLLDKGWIRRIDRSFEGEKTRIRKEYELTYVGRRIFEAEVARLKSLVRVAQDSISGATA